MCTRAFAFVSNLLICLACMGWNLHAQPLSIGLAEPEIETAIKQAMLEGHIPSMTVAVVKDDRVIWTNGYGYANMWARTPAVPSTIYVIGSTFKAMSTVALLRQMERGKFSLDDPVNQYLRYFRIRNEIPERPITFRHLLTHTSGLPPDFTPYPVWGDESPPPIEEYLAASLRVESAPEEKVVYSNMAYTLVGYLVQVLTGEEFRKHIKQQIFKPLEMSSTAFEPTPEMTERLAVPYIVDPNTGSLVPTERLRATEWPAGIVYGTVLDMANWLLVNLNEGTFKGHHLVDAETLELMHTRQYDALKGRISDLWGGEEAGYGLTWWTEVRGEAQYFAHSGSVPGFTAFLQGNKDQRLGVAILSNGNSAHKHLIKLADRIMAVLASPPVDSNMLFGN